MTCNNLGQPVGPSLDWTPPPRPEAVTLKGRTCFIEPLKAHHAPDLFQANTRDAEGRMWTYMSYGPFATLEAYQDWVVSVEGSNDPLFFSVTDAERTQAVGVASYLRIEPPIGVIELGHIAFSPLLQRTTAATEALYLLINNAFELGYRRLEWKCDALNAPSRRAAQRLGFRFEGVFRQATVYKGRNRDTAWYAITDKEWRILQSGFERWLNPLNFDATGRQRQALSELTSTILAEVKTAFEIPAEAS